MDALSMDAVLPHVPPVAVPDDLPPVAARFWRYVQVHTTSDPDSVTTPSTACQKDLARILAAELRTLGLDDIELDAHGYVFATLPGVQAEGLPMLGLIAHVDTSPDAPGAGVRPVLHRNYQGGVLPLPGDPSVTLDPARQPALRAHLGHDLLSSDGTTLLGSDDKAGVAVIMQVVADFLNGDGAHANGSAGPRPPVRVLFTVDEEVGRGVEQLDLARFGADVAYTVDGGAVGGIYAETFNAAEATVRVEGVTVHPGYAKDVMVNAVEILSELIAALPSDETPATTQGRAGYFYAHRLAESSTAEAEARLLLRDFDDDGMARRKRLLREQADRLRVRYPGARITVTIRDQYRNMRAYIEETDPRTIAFALDAAHTVGIEPELKLIRGGTDGARLSEHGIPTPNLFTGGHDFHSVFEWNTVQNLEQTLAYVKALVRYWGAHGAA
ncbi:MAG: peptidase T [Bacteroidota bacterium]